MERNPKAESSPREPALAWLRDATAAGGSAGAPSFFAGSQAAWALETWLTGGDELVALEDRTSLGEPVAARSLAAVHGFILALSGAEARTPRPDARGRLLASVTRRATTSSSLDAPDVATIAPAAACLPAVVAVGQKHAQLAGDVRRSVIVERLGADRREGDPELEKLLAQVDDWLDFPLLVVSVVHGGETVHRAYRTHLSDPPRVVPREASYCTHCVAGDAPLVVENARTDAFFSQHPAALAFNLVAYCGVPLRVGIGTEDEAVLGTLCAYDVRARPVLVEDAATLEVFARRAAAIIEGRVEDSAWADAGSRGEAREVYASGPFLDLALVSLRRAAQGDDAALLVGPAAASIPHGADLAEAGCAVAAGRLPDGRGAWLLRSRTGDGAMLDGVAARLAATLAGQLSAPVALSVLGVESAGAMDVDGWVERASARIVRP